MACKSSVYTQAESQPVQCSSVSSLLTSFLLASSPPHPFVNRTPKSCPHLPHMTAFGDPDFYKD